MSYGDPRSHARDPWLTCPKTKCLALNALDSDRCVECGEQLGLKEEEDK